MSPIRLHPLFGDGAVLQCGEPIPLWGTAEPGRTIHLRLGSHEAVCQSNLSGDFFVWVPDLEPGAPVSIQGSYDNEPSVVLSRNILIGEVWIASGQSNMAWPLEKCGAEGATAIESCHDDALRIFRVNNPPELNRARLVEGSWRSASPEVAAGFPATAFHFARFLREHRNIPVGMVVAAWGGTFIQSWMSRSALLRLSHLAPWTQKIEIASHSPSRWARMDEAGESGLVNNLPADPGNEGLAKNWAAPDLDVSGWPMMHLPGRWQEQGHDFSGVFWFRKSITLPDEFLRTDLDLVVGGFDKHDVCYANGVEIGRTGTGFDASVWNQPRRYSIPSELYRDGSLTLAFRIYSFSGEGGAAGPMVLKTADTELDIGGEWAFQVEHNLGKVEFANLPGHRAPNTPHILYDNLIHPLIPCAARGVIWYQGEQNLCDGDDYEALLAALIEDWRYQWGKPEWPFIIAQLPRMNPPSSFDPNSKWARLRECQRRLVAATPGTALAVTLDLGDESDIHPKQKRDVGRRLAQAALRTVYRTTAGGSGPVPIHCEFKGDSVIVAFDGAGSNLTTKDGEAPSGIYLQAADGKFHSATATLSGNDLVVRSENVPVPFGIRYAWADNPLGANITDLDGIPASPFEFVR